MALLAQGPVGTMASEQLDLAIAHGMAHNYIGDLNPGLEGRAIITPLNRVLKPYIALTANVLAGKRIGVVADGVQPDDFSTLFSLFQTGQMRLTSGGYDLNRRSAPQNPLNVFNQIFVPFAEGAFTMNHLVMASSMAREASGLLSIIPFQVSAKVR